MKFLIIYKSFSSVNIFPSLSTIRLKPFLSIYFILDFSFVVLFFISKFSILKSGSMTLTLEGKAPPHIPIPELSSITSIKPIFSKLLNVLIVHFPP